jgi:hypothetical protein
MVPPLMKASGVLSMVKDIGYVTCISTDLASVGLGFLALPTLEESYKILAS